MYPSPFYPPFMMQPPNQGMPTDPIKELKKYRKYLKAMELELDDNKKKKEFDKKKVEVSRMDRGSWFVLLTLLSPFIMIAVNYAFLVMLNSYVEALKVLVK